MKKQIKIEMNEKELADILSKYFNYDNNTATVSVSHYEGDAREPSSTTIIFTAEDKK